MRQVCEMWRSRLWDLYCVSTTTCLSPELIRFEIAKSMSRYCPPKGTAGLARSAVRGINRFPSPPARMIPKTLGAAGMRPTLGRVPTDVLAFEHASRHRHEGVPAGDLRRGRSPCHGTGEGAPERARRACPGVRRRPLRSGHDVLRRPGRARVRERR